MYDDERIGKLHAHLAEHPHDYQAVIGLLKARSDAIVHEMHEIKVEKLKVLNRVRKDYKDD